MTDTQGAHAQPEALRAAPPSAYSQEDRAFYTFWYGHMLNEWMQPPLAGVSHSTARYIWDAAIAHAAAPAHAADIVLEDAARLEFEMQHGSAIAAARKQGAKHEPLKDCPFCGGNARKVKHSAGSPGTIGYDRWHGVACAGCNACVGARDRRFRTSAAAIAAWNTRTPQPTQAQAGAVPLSDEQIEDLLICGNPTDEEKRLIRMGWDAAHGIKGGQHGTE